MNKSGGSRGRAGHVLRRAQGFAREAVAKLGLKGAEAERAAIQIETSWLEGFADAREQATEKDAGRGAERARCREILCSAEAKSRPKLAQTLALETHLNPDEARKILGATLSEGGRGDDFWARYINANGEGDSDDHRAAQAVLTAVRELDPGRVGN